MRTLLISLSLLLFTLSSSFAQGLETILEAHFKAAAQEKMQKIETIKTTGKNMYSIAGLESGFSMYQARPNMIRIEAEVQGMLVIQTFNGETGWMYAPAMGITEPKELSGQELETMLKQGEFENPLWNYEEKGNSLELIGATEDGSADHIKLTSEKGDVLDFFISRKSHLITTIKSFQVMGSSEQEIEINLKNYKNVKGIPVARYIVTKIGGEIVYTVTIEELEYNKEIDPALFDKPEKIQ